MRPKPTCEYDFIVEWLSKEDNLDNVIPYIQEQKSAGTLNAAELDALRSRVTFIMKFGHEKYLEAGVEDIAKHIVEGAMEVKTERVSGGCQSRFK